MSIDNFNGDRVDVEDCSVEQLQEILADTDRYYPVDQSTGMENGAHYWLLMREQADEIRLELAWRAGTRLPGNDDYEEAWKQGITGLNER